MVFFGVKSMEFMPGFTAERAVFSEFRQNSVPFGHGYRK